MDPADTDNTESMTTSETPAAGEMESTAVEKEKEKKEEASWAEQMEAEDAFRARKG